MPNHLVAHGNIYRNPDNAKEAYLTVTYGSVAQPKNNKNKSLENNSIDFAEHLKIVVIPYLNTLLGETVYTVSNIVDYPYCASIPALIFKHLDNTELSDFDIQNLDTILTKAIAHFNLNLNQIKKSSIFFKPYSRNTSTESVSELETPSAAAAPITPRAADATMILPKQPNSITLATSVSPIVPKLNLSTSTEMETDRRETRLSSRRFK